MTVYRSLTHDIAVEAEAFFLEDRSMPEDGVFLWAYRMRIVNQGTQNVRLMARYWRIIDAAGRLHEVRGTGVIGEQPTIAPGGNFSYVSSTPLPTPSGTMEGVYSMETDAGQRIEIDIPAFALESPYERHPVH
ncbi:MAG: Co2+/Mg2+ efflux protein ApaG [Proteobacteria bacterium]|nr:Co2+/Mg2+ efflux protein ApaG [Pseudomonadota bacterium]